MTDRSLTSVTSLGGFGVRGDLTPPPVSLSAVVSLGEPGSMQPSRVVIKGKDFFSWDGIPEIFEYENSRLSGTSNVH